MEIKGRLLGRLFLGIGMQNREMRRMAAVGRRGQQRGRGHVAKQAGGLAAVVVGDPADAAGGDNQQVLILPQVEPGGPAPADEAQAAAVATAKPIQADRACVWHSQQAGQLPGGAPVLSRTVAAWTQESTVAATLGAVEKAHDGVQIGSYPFWREGRTGANFVIRATEVSLLETVAAALMAGLRDIGIDPVEDGLERAPSRQHRLCGRFGKRHTGRDFLRRRHRVKGFNI
jgi:hypothetical protein